MCGISGFLSPARGFSHQQLDALGLKMGKTIAHRGPDAADSWSDPETGVNLTHRRLSIVDLSVAGNQPMTSACGRYVMVYNGEVYNAADLRNDVADRNITFRGYSDTEAILENCAAFGLEKTLPKLIGMFAIALWDKQTKTLQIVRDRLGIKPLYWAQFKGSFLFASELKPITCHPDFEQEINRDAVMSYLRHSYIPAPASIYKNVHKLMPGTFLTLSLGKNPKIETFWSFDQVAQNGIRSLSGGSDGEVISKLEELLADSVKRRMIADVPLGTFLSGGIDSSIVTALMQAQSDQPIRSYSIGFHENTYNEAKHAAEVAKHLGTDHTELYATPDQVRDIIPQLPQVYDEPFADSSQLPTWLLCKLTREHVTVALSGDGGDELFGGYTRYTTAKKFADTIYCQPRWLRSLESGVIKCLSPDQWTKFAGIIPENKRPTLFGDKLYKIAKVLEGNKDDLYLRLISQWADPYEIGREGQEIQSVLWDVDVKRRIPDDVDRMQYLDTLTYLPDDILTKVDRASMAVSLEARVPLLDHRVVEYAWQLPQHFKIRDGQGKWALRQILYRHVPRELIERPKMGFAIPIADWLRGPLKEWGQELLAPEKVRKYDLVDEKIVAKYWQEHQSGSRNWQNQLWNILMLQSWCEEWLP